MFNSHSGRFETIGDMITYLTQDASEAKHMEIVKVVHAVAE
jgi:hypothetical protein